MLTHHRVHVEGGDVGEAEEAGIWGGIRNESKGISA